VRSPEPLGPSLEELVLFAALPLWSPACGRPACRILTCETENLAAVFLAERFLQKFRRACEISEFENNKKGNGDRHEAGVGTPVYQVFR